MEHLKMTTNATQAVCTNNELTRLTSNGNGGQYWRIDTAHNLADVLKVGFLRNMGKHGLMRNDEILVCARKLTAAPQFQRAFVSGVRPGEPITVVAVGEPWTVEASHMSPWERLGLTP